MDRVKAPTAAQRMKVYRQRLREAGLRPVQIWVADVSSPGFVETCRRQALAVAAADPAGDELLAFAAEAADWPVS